jgi:hypothetical protein
VLHPSRLRIFREILLEVVTTPPLLKGVNILDESVFRIGSRTNGKSQIQDESAAKEFPERHEMETAGYDERSAKRLGRRVTKRTHTFSAHFRRIAARRGAKRALIAVAHAILIVAYAMLKTGTTYQELGGDYLERTHQDELQKYLIRKLQSLGLIVSVQPAA